MNASGTGSAALYWRVAELHVANIDQGFLGTLGVGFVALMYQVIDASPDAILIVAESEGHVVGFVAGAMGMGPVYRGMLRHPFRLGICLLPSLFRPSRVVRILEILSYSRRRRDDGKTAMPIAELLSIAVDRNHRGQRIADSLYAQLCDAFTKRQVPAFKIVVGAALEPAHRFYARMGAVPLHEEELHKGSRSTVYVQQLAAPLPVPMAQGHA